jgi:hypothetical protein
LRNLAACNRQKTSRFQHKILSKKVTNVVLSHGPDS